VIHARHCLQSRSQRSCLSSGSATLIDMAVGRGAAPRDLPPRVFAVGARTIRSCGRAVRRTTFSKIRTLRAHQCPIHAPGLLLLVAAQCDIEVVAMTR